MVEIANFIIFKVAKSNKNYAVTTRVVRPKTSIICLKNTFRVPSFCDTGVRKSSEPNAQQDVLFNYNFIFKSIQNFVDTLTTKIELLVSPVYCWSNVLNRFCKKSMDDDNHAPALILICIRN